MPRMRRYCWCLVVLAALASVVWIIVPRRAPAGSLEALYDRVRVGMTQQQAVELLWGCPDVDVAFSNGTTKGGVSFAHLGNMVVEEMPPPQDIRRCVLKVEDTDGWEVEVTLGPGGVVTGKRYTAPDLWAYLHRWWFGHPSYSSG